MPSRKQRRRRAKERRHEWEEVWVDEEGNEIEEPPDDDNNRSKPERRAATPTARRQPVGRTVQPPSWRRVGKRALIFAPVMFVLVSFVSSELTLSQRFVQTLFLLAFFAPFSYFMDSLMYRMFVRRSGGAVSRKT